MHYAARVVEGISELSEGVLLGERYRLARRLDLFAVGAERVAGVEYEYWIAVDVTSGAEVWIQFAAADGVCAAGSALAGAVSALRRINHPAVPVVPAFGEYEFEQDGAIASVGYCAIPTAEGETLAAALARETLEQTEILAALGQVAEVLELLAEFELVHGHLSAHSVLLTVAEEQAGYGVVIVDLPASLALETALESELTAAADVYALAWLVVLALIGSSTLEAVFGAGFAVTTELELLAGEVALRRLEWAAENLVVLGVSESLAEVLLLALGEAAGRPRVAVLTAALRAEWAASMVEVEVVAEEVAAVEVVAAEVAAVEAVEVVEAAAVEETAEAALLAEALGVMAAESGKTSNNSNKKSNKASKAAVVAGAVAVGAVAVSASAAAAAETEVIPAVKYGVSSASRRAGAGAGAAGGSTAAAGYGRAESASAPVGGGSGAGSGSGAHGAARRRPHPGVLVGAGLGIVIIIVLIISLSSGSPKKSTTVAGGIGASASTGATGTAGTSSTATATASSGAGGSATTTAGSGSSAGASSSATAGAGSGGSTATGAAGTATTFPTLLTTVPASASQAVQQISTAVNQASGELSGTEKGQLGQVVSTLNQEIGSGQSTSTGVAQLWALLHSGELPSSLNTYLIQLATYLSASQGS